MNHLNLIINYTTLLKKPYYIKIDLFITDILDSIQFRICSDFFILFVHLWAVELELPVNI